MVNIHFSITSITKYFPDPLKSSLPWLSVRVSSHDVGSRRVLFMSLFLVLTRFTVVDGVHKVFMCPTVPPHVLEVFPVHPPGICLDLSISGQYVPLLFPVVACWSCLVNAATVSVRSAIVLFCATIISLSSDTAVARLMRASCVPSIYFMLFAPWYPPRAS